jgi:4a-hydroxytetrahydrobiopterin dehydratase
MFVNQIAELAETEGHHPDLNISYNKLRVTLTTHAINGLSENDFILASKIDELEG